jgi:chaperonin GroES
MPMNFGNPTNMAQAGQQPQDIDYASMSQSPQPLPNQLGMHPEPDESPEEESQEQQIRAMIESTNIAEKLDKDKLTKIGQDALKGYKADKESRSHWEDDLTQWTKLACQVREEKSFPWPKASNVKYPLLSTASMQFAARAYPSLLPSDGKIVKAQVIGKDPDGQKAALADRVSMYMSYQLMHDIEGWEESMDKMLIMLPVVGTIFKKTYWDSIQEKVASEVILPKNLVVNYWTKNLNDAERISQEISMSARRLKERQLGGVFLDVDLQDAPQPISTGHDQPPVDETTPYTLIEQHTFLDLDDDGYKEPYIVTFHLETGKVLRIAARFDHEGIKFDESGKKIIRIKPIQYFTKFGFVPNPDGGFYDIGFGVLLGPINEAVNTLINQLTDSGTLSNLQSGFIGKGLRIRMGETAFQPGEWKAVNATGDDIKKSVFPLPVREPSMVLFQLMGSLITSGKELASVAEIFVGKMPGQNTPATTTMATIEQGMKVFTAVYKRLYRSLAEEFKKLFELNGTYLNPNTYTEILGVTVGPNDFSEDQYKICPGADPTAVSQTEKLLKAQGLMELLNTGVLDPVKVVLRMLDAQEQPNIQELLNQQVAQTGQLPQQPNPKLIESQAKVQALQQASQIKQNDAQFKMELDARDAQFKQAMAAQAQDQDMRHKEVLNMLQRALAIHTENEKTAQDRQQFLQQTVHKEVAHRQDVSHKSEMAAVQRKQASMRPKSTPSSKRK